MPTAGTQLVWAQPREGFAGQAPECRSGHSLTLLPREYKCNALLFGGRDAVSGRHCNDLWQLALGDLTPPHRGAWQWTMLTIKPSVEGAPSRREGHTATVFRNYLVIFGGLGPSGLLNDVSAFNLDTMEWAPPPTSGLPPIRRHRHSACTFARQWVIFGGFSEYGDVENDLSVLDMDVWKWFVPKISGEAPCPRMAHSATRFGKDMLVYGGYCLPEIAGEKRYLCDLFVLKTDTWTWSTPEMGSAVPSALERAGHTATAVQDLLLILGGRGENHEEFCDVWTLDTSNWVWSKPSPVPEMAMAVMPAVSDHAMMMYGTPYSDGCPTGSGHLSPVPRLIIWGGSMRGTPEIMSKAWVLEFPALEYAGDDETDVFLPESEGVGNSVVSRPEIASQRNWQILDTEVTFPRNGIIVQWEVWVNEPGTVRLQVYRPVAREGRAARMKFPYMLVGENVITFKDTGFCPVPVIDRDQVTVQKGDMIGMRIDSDSKLLADAQWPNRLQAGERVDGNGSAVTPSGVVAFEYHTSDDPTDPNARHGGHLCRYCTHEYLGIGDCLDFNDDHARNHLGITLLCHRLMSIRAIIVPAPDQTPMPQEEVDEAEPEADFLYLIKDPTLAPRPRAVLVELREEKLLELQNPGLATTSRVRKGAAKKGGTKPGTNTSPAKMRGDATPVKGTDSARKGADAKSKTDKYASGKVSTGKKIDVGEGAKTALAKPVLDGRRLPEGERLPKELATRERQGTGPFPAPVLHDDSVQDEDGYQGQESQ